MTGDEPFVFTDAAKLSVGNVRAPACPVGSQATWAQIVTAFASMALFAALLIGALTRNPASLLGAGLSLIALAVASWVFVGAIKHAEPGVGSG